MKGKRRRTPEERAEAKARGEELARRLEAAIARRKREAEQRRAAGETPPT
jgi:hypothetical protein